MHVGACQCMLRRHVPMALLARHVLQVVATRADAANSGDAARVRIAARHFSIATRLRHSSR